MKDFEWDFDKLLQDIKYDNQSHYRLIGVSVLTILLYALIAFLGAFSTVGLLFSAIIVSLIVVFCVSLSVYFLVLNKKNVATTRKNINIVSMQENILVLDGVKISYSNIVCIVKSKFKNVNPFNSSDIIDEGDFVYLFVKNTDLRDLGTIRSWSGSNSECVRIPLKYFNSESSDFVESVNSLSDRLGIKSCTENTSMGFSKIFIEINSSLKFGNDFNSIDSCSSLERF